MLHLTVLSYVSSSPSCLLPLYSVPLPRMQLAWRTGRLLAAVEIEATLANWTMGQWGWNMNHGKIIIIGMPCFQTAMFSHTCHGCFGMFWTKRLLGGAPPDHDPSIIQMLGKVSVNSDKYPAGWWFGCHQFYFPIYWVANHPNWLSYFSEGLKPPTSMIVSWLNNN